MAGCWSNRYSTGTDSHDFYSDFTVICIVCDTSSASQLLSTWYCPVVRLLLPMELKEPRCCRQACLNDLHFYGIIRTSL